LKENFMSTNPIVPTPPPTVGGTTTPTNGLPSGQSLNNMFLQLLVAQLQHQDPTSPVDPSQFVGQLAQFSELSEVTSIYTLLQQVVPATGGSGSGGGTPPATGSLASAGTSPVAAAAASALASLPAAAVPAANATVPNFASPSISAVTSNILSKIQGAF
jgi:flagellar basal-body rod modification protein FlgD